MSGLNKALPQNPFEVTAQYDLSPAIVEGKIRDKLINLGWTPPNGQPAYHKWVEQREQRRSGEIIDKAAVIQLAQEAGIILSGNAFADGMYVNVLYRFAHLVIDATRPVPSKSVAAQPLTTKDVDACFDGLMPSGCGKSRYDIAAQIIAAYEAKAKRNET